MTVLKYIYADGNDNLLVDFNREKALFKRITRNLKVVLIGRGITGGRPIGKTLTAAGINYININSSTPNPNDYYKDADIIVTAVGKKVIHPEMLKEGVVLINVGLRREGGKLKGDYDEREIKNIASHYTPTPGGTGPIDVLYLFENLIEAAKLQK
jgi:methylenetetrahydrofolate dehydrogenase (NADP+)/methenyltetrahydrofolate cyclohydrolase